MPARQIPVNNNGLGRRVGIVLSRFNPGIGDLLQAGALRALKEAGVADRNITVATVPGALEVPLALQRMAQSGEFDALVALGAVIRGETYHFEIVANESARGVVVLLHRPESAGELRRRAVTAEMAVSAKVDLRDYGIGAQILRDLNVGRMRLLATPRKMPSMAGFDLEVTGYVAQPAARQAS